MATLELPGRILYLSDDPALVAAQLSGRALSRSEAGRLRDDVSTDEITPVPILTHYDDALARYPYTGFKTSGSRPILADAIRQGGFSVTVAGKRYGKGSSREHSPTAEKLAGIRLVIAESFERIYRQNADNIGLFTSTDFGLIDRVAAGEPIGIEELVAGRDALAAEILKVGGLLRFGRRFMHDIRLARAMGEDRPRTLFEKILARHALATELTSASIRPGDGAFVRADWRFIHEYYTGMCAHMLHSAFGKPLMLHDSTSIVVFEDHTSYVTESPAHVREDLVPNVAAMCRAQREFVADYGLREHRTLTEDEAARNDRGSVAGISHAMMAERYAMPGQLIVGTDSHTPHSGALGCVAFGVGTTDMANAFMTGAVRLTVPESIRVELVGRLPAGVTAKDVALHLLSQPSIRAGSGVGKVFEFCGPVVTALKTDERATLTNMTAELGGFTGIVEPDAETVRFLRERRGIEVSLEPWMQSDHGAHYAEVISVDCSRLTPLVARPGDPGNAVALGELPDRVHVDIAYAGSCTGGKREDFDHYHEVLAWASRRGLRVPDGTALYLQFGTTAVRDYCVARGYLQAFERVGARILQPSCGACANCGPGSSIDSEQVTVSAINRNFPGRSGPGQVWLASPPTVAASAIAGRLVSFAELRARTDETVMDCGSNGGQPSLPS
ncbi:MAG TPA: aconitase family protein [Bradyrhizobium sp.]|uniref:aconitase family protein n=1 Tax=Bradyrhizobium sp. TaxID=376 RepID=UPI002BD3C3D7|nr:aconitase family protein [Bradyrhizobium sp.]HLZ04363.1 aconitase family protein [Bradyrhizobium sp.]